MKGLCFILTNSDLDGGGGGSSKRWGGVGVTDMGTSDPGRATHWPCDLGLGALIANMTVMLSFNRGLRETACGKPGTR